MFHLQKIRKEVKERHQKLSPVNQTAKSSQSKRDKLEKDTDN